MTKVVLSSKRFGCRSAVVLLVSALVANSCSLSRADESAAPRASQGSGTNLNDEENKVFRSSKKMLPPQRPMFGAEPDKFAFDDDADANDKKRKGNDDAQPFEEDTEKAEQKKRVQKQIRDNVKRLFRGLQRMLGPKRGPDPPPAAEKQKPIGEQDADKQKKRQQAENRPITIDPIDGIDALAPYDASLQKVHSRIINHVKRQQWDDALGLIEQLLHSANSRRGIWASGNPMIIRGIGNRVLLIDEINRLISQLPETQRLKYSRAHEAEAESRLAEAIAENDILKLSNVSQMYYHTPAGIQATNRLGSLHLDRGEFGLAALSFLKLLNKESSAIADPIWAFKAALACRKAGFDDESDHFLRRFISESEKQESQIGGGTDDLSKWIDLAKTAPHIDVPVLDDWPLLYGSPQRVGTASGGMPLLLSEWSNSMTFSDKVRVQSELIRNDLIEAGRAVIPAMTPLLVQGRAIYRTMRGVSVVDVKTGQLLWETMEKVSAETLLTGTSLDTAKRGVFQAGQRQRPAIAAYNGSQTDHHPLTSLLYRDGVYGTLTSDGSQVFVLEDQAVMAKQKPGQYRRNRSSHQDSFHRDWASNRIVSYDLASGSFLWSVGGTKMNEVFEPALTGSCFLGSPVPDGDELYVIGEKEKTVELHCLDRNTGEHLWTQLLAYSDAEIEWDFGRRWWNTQVSSANGVIVCPTSIGWLVGIDRLKRSVLWMYRYTKPSKSLGDHKVAQRSQVVGESTLNLQWGPSAPVISGNHVIYTPAESPYLVCLNLYTGQQVWKKGKDNNLYLAGVFGDRAVVVGKDAATAISIRDGKELWRCRWGSANQTNMPCGMGVAVGREYYLPLSQGELAVIDMEQGEIVSRTALPENDRLGNLSMYQGLLLSLDATQFKAYRQRDAVITEIDRRKKADAHDEWALLSEANILRSEDQHSDALDRLSLIDQAKLNPAQREEFRVAMFTSLVGVIQRDLGSSRERIAQLKALLRSPIEQFEYYRLLAAHHSDRSEYRKAFAALWEFAMQPNEEFMVEQIDQPRVEVRATDWLSGELELIWKKMSAVDRDEVDRLIGQTMETAFSTSIEDATSGMRILRFHPHYWKWNQLLVSRMIEQEQFLQAEGRLIEQSHHKEASIAAEGLIGLVELMSSSVWQGDAGFYLAKLTKNYAETILPDGTKVQDALADLTDIAETPSVDRSWKASDYKIEQTGTGYNGRRVQELNLDVHRLPYWRRHRYEVRTGANESVNMLDARNDSVEWRLPLRSDAGHRSSGRVVRMKTVGHRLLLSQRGTLYSVSPSDKQVVWQHQMDVPTSEPQRTFFARHTTADISGNVNVGTFSRGSGMKSQHVMRVDRRPDFLFVANSDYVCFAHRRDLVVLDAETGALRWKYRRLPQGATVFGTEEVVVVVSPGIKSIQVYRARDGRPVKTNEMKSILQKCISVLPTGFLLVDETTGKRPENVGKRVTRIRLYSPLNDVERWSRTFDHKTAFSLLGERVLLSLHPQDGMKQIDLETGSEESFSLDSASNADDEKSKSKSAEAITKWSDLFITSVSQVHTLSDGDKIYLVFNRRRGTSHSMRHSDELSSIHLMRGTIIAFDATTGKGMWQHYEQQSNLLGQYFTHSPVLILTNQRSESVGSTRYTTTQIRAVDKKTGRLVVNKKVPIRTRFQSMLLNVAEKYVELRTYNQRVRIQATWKPFLERSL